MSDSAIKDLHQLGIPQDWIAKRLGLRHAPENEWLICMISSQTHQVFSATDELKSCILSPKYKAQ